jgi:flagellar hook-associated protein 3 FlgL
MSSAFRITQRTLTGSTLANLQANLVRMQTIQARLSSGRAIQKPSDSPTGTVSALRLRAELRRSTQLDRNAHDGLGWLGSADTTLTDALGQVRQARELLLAGANGAMSDSDRAALANEVDGLRTSLLAAANTEYLNQPLFAGTAAPAQTYDAAGVYQGNTGQVTRTVASGVKVPVNLSGDQVFGPAGNTVFDVLADVATHLRSDPAALTATDLDRLDAAFLRLQNASATVGSRYHQIDAMVQRNDSLRIDATDHLSEVEGVDLPATAVELQLQEVAYQAALGATAKVLQPSLMDFLR